GDVLDAGGLAASRSQLVDPVLAPGIAARGQGTIVELAVGAEADVDVSPLRPGVERDGVISRAAVLPRSGPVELRGIAIAAVGPLAERPQRCTDLLDPYRPAAIG